MSTAVATDTGMSKEEFKQVQLRDVSAGGGLSLALNSFAELEKFSHFMALSNFVPKHLRGKQADCLAVLLQSMRWNMDPFAVSQKTYFVNDVMAYEAQLVNAIVLSRAQLKSRPKLSWSGEGENLKCTVSGVFIGEDVPQEFEAEMKMITTRNSSLWKQQPKQQLAYFALRAWARLYCPDVLMGVYTKDEVENSSFHIGPDNAIDITANREVVESVIAGIQAEKEAEKPEKKTEPAKQPDVIEHTEEAKKDKKQKAKEAGADPQTGELLPPNADDWIHDILIAPDIAGMNHKYAQAQKIFANNKDFARIHEAKEKRKAELTQMQQKE